MDSQVNKPYKDIDSYIAAAPEEVRPILEKIRRTIRKAAPQAEETISYGMPAFRQNKVLVYFAAFKDHIGFFPAPSGISRFKKDLARYATSKGTIRFPLDEPLPLELIEKIVKFRVTETRSKTDNKKNKASSKK